MIKALFFDSGNVLTIEGFTPGIAEYEKTNNIPAGKLYASAHDREYWKDFTLGNISEGKYYKCVADDFDEPLDVEKLRAVIYKNFQHNWELLEYIKTLKDKYILGIISNNPKKWFDYLWQTGGWKDLFTVRAVSAYLRIRKPDIKIYSYALKQASVLGDEAIYVDDRLDRIQGAKSLGMKFIIYKNLKQLKQDIAILK